MNEKMVQRQRLEKKSREERRKRRMLLVHRLSAQAA
jgi:hypothetical protein